MAKMTLRTPMTVTAEQKKWLDKNKAQRRTSHAGVVAKFTHRGTLRPDGTFIPEGPKTPMMDGNGSFGVGIPVQQGRRRGR